MYVDNYPVVLAHARVLLTSNQSGATEYIDADLPDTPAILAQAAKLQDIGSRMVQQSLALRNREQVAQFFAGTDLVAPVSCG